MNKLARTIKIEIPVEVIDRTGAVASITGKLRGMGKAMGDATGRTSGFEKAYQRTMRALSTWTGKRYQSSMEMDDKVSPILQRITSTASRFTNRAWSATVRIKDMATAPLKKILGLAKSPMMTAGIGIGVGASVGSAVSTYAGFESQMSQVKAITGATQEEFAQLTAKAKEMGASTKFTAQESAEAFNYMGMASWKATDMMGGIEGVLNLAAASGENLGTTSDIVTDALTAFNMNASDSMHFSDVLATAASNANTTVSGMGDTFKYVGSMAGAMGYSIEDVALATGLMANAGIKGSMSGTALNAMLTRLSTNTSGATDAIKALGVEFYNSDGSARALSDVMGELRQATSGMSAEQKSSLANTVAGMEAQKGLLAILNASEADYNKLSTAIGNADGASKKMADTMLDNLSGKFTLFKSTLDGVKISLGERVKPYLMDALDWLTAKMPAIESALMHGMDGIDSFMEQTKERIAGFTVTQEWNSAGLFGKMSIAWDELVATPFSEWWDGGGKDTITGKVAQIGQSIGAGLSGGLLTLLGIDIGTGIDEGASIGKSFAKGFISGFDTGAVMKAVSGALGGMLKNAGKLLTGNGDLSSWLSAAAIAKIASPLLGAGMAGIKWLKAGKSALGAKADAIARGTAMGSTGAGLGSTILGSAAAGTGLKGLGLKAGMVGIKLGSGAASGAGLIAAGAGSVAGGAAAGATLISGGMDLYNAATTDDEEKQKAYRKSAGYKFGGTATGAAAGAAIGSMFGGIGAIPGALIGAGIGGIAGWFGGNNAKEEYEESKLMEEKSKYVGENARFESEKLKSAMEDTSVSAGEFGEMMKEAASQKIQDSFGNIKLSMEEIKEAAKEIAFGGDDEQLTKFASSMSDAEASMGDLRAAATNMDKMNWKASMGMVDDEQGVAEYQAGIKDLVSGAQRYVEDQHYEATAAISLLARPESQADFMSSLDSMYAEVQEELGSASGKLTAKMEIALEDGVITMDEQAELSNLQGQVTDITSQLSSARSDAGMQALKIKYSGAQLDADSFANLTTELQAQVQEAAGNYDEALEVGLTNLNMQLERGAINQEQFDSQVQELTEGYQAQMEELSINVESFQLESIADAFGGQLDGILPNLEGNVAERLGEAMHNAMAAGVDVENWDVSTAAEWLDLDGVSEKTQGAITEMMSQVAASMPDQMVEALDQSGDMGETVSGMLANAAENADFSQVGGTFIQKFGESLNGMDFSESGSGLTEGIQNSLNASLENVDLSGVAETLNANLGTAMSSIDMSESGGGLQEGIQNSIAASLEGMDLSSLGEGLSASLGASVSSMDFSGVSSAIGTGISSAVQASLPSIQTAISNLYGQVGSAINSAFSAGFTTSTTVTITVNYKLANPSATISFSGGGTGTATVSAGIASNAEGSIVNGRLLSWVGEDGPEAIIPLGNKRRQRGLDLWMQAGRMMGVGEHAEGGIIGGSGESQGSTFARDVQQSVPESGNIVVQVNLNPNFQVSESDENAIVKAIKANMRELAEDMGAEIAVKVSEVFENTPIAV